MADIGKTVRTATAADATAVQAIYAPVVRDTAISFEEEEPSVPEMARRIAATLETYPFLVLEEAGQVLGFAYAGALRVRAAYRWSAEITAYVDARARGRGIGRTLYDALLDTLKRQRFHAAFAGVALPNPASVGLLKAVGFSHFGTYQEVGFKFGRWHDVAWWRLPLAAGLPAGEPIPFRDLDAQRPV